MDDPSDAAFIRVLLDLSRKNTQAFYAIYWSFIGKYVDVSVTKEVDEAKTNWRCRSSHRVLLREVSTPSPIGSRADLRPDLGSCRDCSGSRETRSSHD